MRPPGHRRGRLRRGVRIMTGAWSGRKVTTAIAWVVTRDSGICALCQHPGANSLDHSSRRPRTRLLAAHQLAAVHLARAGRSRGCTETGCTSSELRQGPRQQRRSRPRQPQGETVAVVTMAVLAGRQSSGSISCPRSRSSAARGPGSSTFAGGTGWIFPRCGRCSTLIGWSRWRGSRSSRFLTSGGRAGHSRRQWSSGAGRRGRRVSSGR